MHCDCSTCTVCIVMSLGTLTKALVTDYNLHIDSRIVFNQRVKLEMYKKAVGGYKSKWARKEKVDVPVLNEWEHKVIDCTEWRIWLLSMKQNGRRKTFLINIWMSNTFIFWCQQI